MSLQLTIMLVCVDLSLLLETHGSSLYAAEEPMEGKPALSGKSCQTPPDSTWTPQEQWVWERLCRGQRANFNSGEGCAVDPKKPEHWTEDRVLRPEFIEAIAINEPYRSALHRRGIIIAGAWFKQPINLSYATLSQPLGLHCSRFESDIELRYFRTSYPVSFSGSNVSGKLSVVGARIGDSPFLIGEANLNSVDLTRIDIGGYFSITGAIVTEKAVMDSIKVGGNVNMNGGNFAEVVLTGAVIGGQLNMTESTFSKNLIMESIKVVNSLFMRAEKEPTKFSDVNLRNAYIGGKLEMIGAIFTGKLDMEGLKVNQSLLMDNITTNTSNSINLEVLTKPYFKLSWVPGQTTCTPRALGAAGSAVTL